MLPLLGLLAFAAFAISLLATRAMISLAPRIGFVDKPGHRKIHHIPKPLGGGVAIYLAFVLPMLAAIVVLHAVDASSLPLISRIDPAYISGARMQTPLALALLGAMTVFHVLGLIDDKRALGPYFKLCAQLATIAALVIPFSEMRILTFLDSRLGTGGIISIVLTVLWIGAITNAFNFLDNMDGLSSGVAAVCSLAFLVAAISIEQWFVAATLALFLGAVLGFWIWNFPPAKIFMGDSGSLLLGLVLGVLTVRTTFLPPGETWGGGWYAVFVPVIVLALPLYDFVTVSIIRISRGRSPFVGDNNHFSHRLVARGMSRRTAVLCIYLMTAATSISAIVLPHVSSTYLALLILGQTLLVLALVALLEQHPLPVSRDDGTAK